MQFKIENHQIICTPTQNYIEEISVISLYQADCQLTLYSVFKRFKQGRSRHQKHLGDNCPMLYALKGLDNLSVSREHQTIFYDVACQSIQAHFGDILPFDAILLLPSSHAIAQHCAAKIAEYYQIQVINNWIQKKTNQQMKQEINHFFEQKTIDLHTYQILMQKLDFQNDSIYFSLKQIPVKYRIYTQPFCMVAEYLFRLPENSRILLLDDICSSGISLLNATNLLHATYPNMQISALTLFGKID